MLDRSISPLAVHKAAVTVIGKVVPAVAIFAAVPAVGIAQGRRTGRAIRLDSRTGSYCRCSGAKADRHSGCCGVAAQG